jgi:uncharacterized membrane protein
MIKKISIYIISFAYIFVGIKHFTDPHFFSPIVPHYLPYPLALVYISGFFEILFGLLFLINKYRKIAAWGLILLLIAVFPANIFLVQNIDAQIALNVTKDFAIYRLPFQLLFILLAYWHTK